jgi:hypothetical protein
VIRKVFLWHANYKRGDPSASRGWINIEGRVVDKVTKYANRVRFKPAELDHLIRILDALAPTRELVEYFRAVRKGIRRGKLLPGGEYEIVLNAYKQDVEETLNALVKAKTGRTNNIADIVKEQVEQGKSPW